MDKEEDTGFTGGPTDMGDHVNLNSIGPDGIRDPDGNLISGFAPKFDPPGGNTNQKQQPQTQDPQGQKTQTQQPQAQQPMTADWQYGLWDFADAPMTFCQAWCCPSYSYARNLNDFEGGGSGCICCGTDWWKHFCLTWFCCGASCLIRSPLRTKIRRKSSIKQSYRDTIGSCCWPCGLTQETREIEFQKGQS